MFSLGVLWGLIKEFRHEKAEEIIPQRENIWLIRQEMKDFMSTRYMQSSKIHTS